MYTPNFDYKFSMARAETELCGLCLCMQGFKLIVGFLVLLCPVALLGIRCLRALALLSLRPRNTMALPFLKFSFTSLSDYLGSYQMGQSEGGRKRENPKKKHLAHRQAELGLSHVASAGLEPTWRYLCFI